MRGPLAARTAVVAAMVSALAGVTALTTLRHARQLRAGWPAESDVYFLPGTGFLHLASLGHPEAAADLVSARTNVYFGGQISKKTEPNQDRRLERFLMTVVELDPKFHRMYLQGASMLIYGGSNITVEKVEAATRLLERGVKEFPGDWELGFHLGFDRYFELPQAAGADDPRVPRWRQQGVESLRQAALLDGAPAWLPNLVARMLTKQGQNELAIKHLEQAYASTSNEETRLQIREKLMLLRRSTAAAELERQERELKESLSQRYDYAPEAFSLIAGARRKPMALDALMQGENRP